MKIHNLPAKLFHFFTDYRFATFFVSLTSKICYPISPRVFCTDLQINEKNNCFHNIFIHLFNWSRCPNANRRDVGASGFEGQNEPRHKRQTADRHRRRAFVSRRCLFDQPAISASPRTLAENFRLLPDRSQYAEGFDGNGTLLYVGAAICPGDCFF